MTTDRFPPYIIAAARASHRRFYPYGPFVSIILAQWAVEAAYGTRVSGRNNFFGIKALSGEPATEVWTKEFVNGKYISAIQRFAAYDTVEDGLDAHGQLLVSHHYILCMRAQSPADYARALHTCGYATAPNYAEVLIAVMDQNTLYQYDEQESAK